MDTRGRWSYMVEVAFSVAGAVSFMAGLILLIRQAFLPSNAPSNATQVGLELGYLSLGLGMLGVGLAMRAIDIARDSDEKMKAIANLEFDEKAAMLEELEGGLIRGFDAQLHVVRQQFLWDIEAMAHVARWVKSEKRVRASDSIDRLMPVLGAGIPNHSLEMFRRLSREIKGNTPDTR